jgi:hypothetical protein
VAAARTTPWSNGAVEGHGHGLKLSTAPQKCGRG